MLLHWSDAASNVAQASVGQYHSGRVLPLLLVSVATMVGGVLLPYMSEAWEAGRKHQAIRQLNLSYKLIGLSFTFGGVLVLLTAPFFFNTFLQGRYNDGLAVLPMTLVYCIWFSLYTVGQDYLWVAEKGKLATLAVGAGLAINIGLNGWLIPSWGLMGAVWATALGNLALIVLILVLNHCWGCRTDRGIWLLSCLPLILLLPPMLGLLILIVFSTIAIHTNWIFDREEKQQGRKMWQGLERKFTRR
jgi:polysaccharide transporter, PST family